MCSVDQLAVRVREHDTLFIMQKIDSAQSEKDCLSVKPKQCDFQYLIISVTRGAWTAYHTSTKFMLSVR